MMKATLRNNGLMMVTFTAKFSAGRDNLIDVVRDRLLHEDKVTPNRGSIIKLARSAARLYGNGFTFESLCDEDAGPEKDVWEKATADATAIIDKAFPEMKPKEPASVA